jgi:hypothetical protein
MDKLNKSNIKWTKDPVTGKWTYTIDKKLTKPVKLVRLGDILDNGPEDELSDPELLRESGGHIDPESGEWQEDDS